MKLFHISHTDLDGYGCHLLAKEIFEDNFCINANYGTEVNLGIDLVIKEIKKLDKTEEIFILITDVNLTLNEAKKIDKEVNELNKNGYKIKLQLLDHHITGKKCEELYDWYYLDVKRCATKITYEYLIKEFKAFSKKEDMWLAPLVECINAIDIWIEDDEKAFEFGKVLMRLVSQAREINNTLFPNANRDYRIYLIKQASAYFEKTDGNIDLDSDIHKIKKEYLNDAAKDDTIDNLSAKRLNRLIINKKDELTLNFKGHKGILTYCLGSISIPANAFLKANRDFDFFIDVNKKGFASLRADGKIDVSKMAQNFSKSGGGHKNASGCRIDDFKEAIDIKDVKEFIQNALDKISK